MTDNKSPKIPKKFECVHCNYLCSNKKDYNKHILTIKHQRLTNTDAKIPKNDSLHCICGKAYKHRQSLHNHHKKCLFTNNQCITEDTQIQESAMDNLIKQRDKKISDLYVKISGGFRDRWGNFFEHDFTISYFYAARDLQWFILRFNISNKILNFYLEEEKEINNKMRLF